MHIVSHRTCGSRPPCTRHPIHACAPVRCVVVVSLHPSPVFFYLVPLLFFQPFQMSSSEFHERLRSNPLCDFRLGTVATSDHETPLTEGLNPAPHIHEQMTTSNYGYDIAYNFTHNNIMLEPNAMNNMNTVAHMDVHNTQY